MSFWIALVALVAGASLAVRAQKAAAQAAAPSLSGDFLVRYRPGADASRRSVALAGAGAGLLRRFAQVGIDHVRVPGGPGAPHVLAALRADPEVLSVDPDYVRTIVAAAPPNDPFWLNGSLWGLVKIKAQPAWTGYTTGSASIVVADIDTGVNYTHPDLAGNMWTNPGEIPGNGVDDDGDGYVDDVYGIDTINGDSDPMDDNGHGTHVAGTIGARGDNGTGVVGVSWAVKIMACKFLNAAGSGTDSGAIACLNYAVLQKSRGVNVRVINGSWGAARGASASQSLKSAFDTAANAGILSVVAAGNDSENTDAAPFDPASFTSPGILAVAASDQIDNRASFSNYGATSIDIAAPGVGIVSTLGTSYANGSGTSMAAPHVAGAAALLLSRNPNLSVSALKAAILDTADPLPQWSGLVVSGGRLNVYAAMSAVASANLPPSIAITAPAAGAAFTAPASIAIAASAADSDGTVAKVDFYANGALIGTDTTAPYGMVWGGVGAGSYTLTARATDDLGATVTSNPVSTTVSAPGPGYSLEPGATSVPAGGALSVTWTAPYGRPGNDWVALYPVGAAAGSYVWWTYTNGASQWTASLAAPSQPGQYEFRYLLQDGFSQGAVSAPVTVSAATGGYAVAAGPASAGTGGTLHLSWTAPYGRPGNDWVALYPVGATGGNYVWWTYTQGAPAGHVTLTAPATPGQYEARYFLQDSFAQGAASAPVSVFLATPDNFSVAASPGSGSPGASITVHWTAPSGRPGNDWVALYPVGATGGSYVWWMYTNGAVIGSGSVTASLAPGQYEFRYLLQDGFTQAAGSSLLTIYAAPSPAEAEGSAAGQGGPWR